MRLFIGRVYAAFDAGGGILPTMYVIVNRELRQIVQEFETREEADARLAEIVKEDAALADMLIVMHEADAPPTRRDPNSH